MTTDESPGEVSSYVVRPSSLVDTHCHLGWRSFDEDRDEAIQRAVDAGVTRIVTIGVDAPSSRDAIALAERYEAVYAAVGVHPNDSAGFNNQTLDEIRALGRHPKVVAVGEIGLDNHWQKVPPDVQMSAFKAQLDLAAEIGKPVVIHSRDATDEILTTLEQRFVHHASRFTRGVLHAFSGGLDAAQRAFAMGFLIGFGGPITFKKSHDLRELVGAIPADRFVVETDAPFLAPEPRRGRRNEPAHVRYIAERIARERRASFEDIAGQSTANAARLFGWTDAYGAPSY